MAIRPGGVSGKEKATGEKVRHLQEVVEDFSLVSIQGIWDRMPGLLANIALELRYMVTGLLSRRRPDVIITRSLLCFGTHLVSTVRGIPVIREWHADFWDEARILYEGQRLRLFAAWALQKWMLFFLARSDGVIFNNVRLAEHYERELVPRRYRSIVVGNGADLVRFYPEPANVVRTRLGLDPERFYLLFVGSMSPWHGVEHMLDAFEELLAQQGGGGKVDLLVVGGSHASKAIRDRLADLGPRVIQVGPVCPERAREYMCASDICLLPTAATRVSPGSPLKLYDYAACGRCIVTQQSTPGYSDIVDEFALGYTVDFRQPKEAASALLDALGREDLERRQRHNRQVAVESLSWRKVVERWLAFSSAIVTADAGRRALSSREP